MVTPDYILNINADVETVKDDFEMRLRGQLLRYKVLDAVALRIKGYILDKGTTSLHLTNKYLHISHIIGS